MTDSNVPVFRAQLRYADLDAFVDGYARFVSAGRVFVPTDPSQLKPEGTHVQFEFLLEDGSRALVGEGEIRGARSSSDSGDGPAGMIVEYTRLGPESNDVVEAMVGDGEAGGAEVEVDVETGAEAGPAEPGRDAASPGGAGGDLERSEPGSDDGAEDEAKDTPQRARQIGETGAGLDIMAFDDADRDPDERTEDLAQLTPDDDEDDAVDALFDGVIDREENGGGEGGADGDLGPGGESGADPSESVEPAPFDGESSEPISDLESREAADADAGATERGARESTDGPERAEPADPMSDAESETTSPSDFEILDESGPAGGGEASEPEDPDDGDDRDPTGTSDTDSESPPSGASDDQEPEHGRGGKDRSDSAGARETDPEAAENRSLEAADEADGDREEGGADADGEDDESGGLLSSLFGFD